MKRGREKAPQQCIGDAGAIKREIGKAKTWNREGRGINKTKGV